MLKKILTKKDCEKCKFCCAFRKSSLWETPLFPKETAEKLKDKGEFEFYSENGFAFAKMILLDKYKTDSEFEEVPCHFLNNGIGCTLSDEDKPFDCKIWPLRVMKKENRLVIALTPTCPAINGLEKEKISTLVKNELADMIFKYARENPYIIKEYRNGFSVLETEK